MSIKFGIIGYSHGNGHPFSWSIACNGYKKKYLDLIPYKNIRNYLPKYDLNYHKIKNAEVTHIWTHNLKVSKLIGKVCNIKNISKSLKELTESVDAILFLRDDLISRKKYLKEVLRSGKPVYLDKFIALKELEVKKYLRYQKYDGQIFSESPFCNSKKLILNKKELKEIGKIKAIYAISNGSWESYSSHVVQPVLKFIKVKKILKYNLIKSNQVNNLNIKWSNKIITNFITLGKSFGGIYINIIGEKSEKKISWDFDAVFGDFIVTIKKFIYMIENKKKLILKKEYLLLSKVLEKGL